MANRLKKQLVLDMARLGIFATKKLPACRQVKKQRSGLHRCAGSFTGRFHRLDFPSVYYDLGALGAIRQPGSDPESRNAGDAWERLSAEAERPNLG